MNTKLLFVLMGLLCAFGNVWTTNAQLQDGSDANLMGHVLDKATGEHLSYINVFVVGTMIGTSTDDTGHYLLTNLPEGDFEVEFKTLGYKTVKREVTFKAGKTIELNVELEEDQIALDGVVVSANRNETTRRLAPTLVNVLDSKMFTTTNAVNLAQGLNFQPGVRVENNCQNCGFQQVRINGLDGPYTQILLDSRPIFSALSGVYGLEQIPANMVERVEVMRGGGSALYGASAIAGTINIITKEPLRNSADVSHNMTVSEEGTFDNSTALNASLVTSNRKAGVYLFGQNRHRQALDYDGDGFTELPKLDNQTVGFRAYVKTTDYSKLTFEYHHMHEFRRGGDQLDRPPHEVFIAEQTEHNVDGGGLKFDLFSKDYKHKLNVYASAQHIGRESYYGTHQDPNAYGQTTDLTAIAGAQYNYSFAKLLFMPSELTLGLEYSYDNLRDESLGYNRIVDQTIHIESAFFQNEWKNERWSFLIGGRLDKHNQIDHVVFSPRANIRYNPNENVNIRASYSSGFRAPQAFDEDLHIAAVGGEAALIQLADNLSEEKSRSLSASVDLYHRFARGVQVNFLVEGFYTNLSDVFVLEDIGRDEQGNLIKERRNGSGARVMGLTLEGKSVLTSWLSIQAGFTWQRSRYKEAEKWSEDPTVEPTKKMFRTPDTYGYFTSTLTPIKRLTIALSGTYTGEMLVQHLAGYIEKDEAVRTPDFFDMNIKFSYDIPIYNEVTLTVNAGVQNLFNAYQSDFDQGPDRDSGYIYGPGSPRMYFAGLKVGF